MSSTPAPTKNTTAFFVQAGVSFAVAMLGLAWALVFMPMDPWQRGFLGMTTLFLVSSSFTLAKVIRDAQDDRHVVTRLDQARVEKILTEHDPFKSVM